MVLTNKVYDVMKWIAQYFLPGLGALYFALAGIWGFPYGEEVVGTLVAVDAFLGLLLGLSSLNYPGEGSLVVNTTDPDKDVYRLELSIPVEQLANRRQLTFKIDDSVKTNQPPSQK
jgi:hypothetical protein